MVASENPNELSMAVSVAGSLDMYNQMTYWIKTIFQGKVIKYKKFVQKPVIFIDNYCIRILADYLNGTSNKSNRLKS